MSCCDRGPQGQRGAQGAQGGAGSSGILTCPNIISLADAEQKETSLGSGLTEVLYEWNADFAALQSAGLFAPYGVYVSVIMRTLNAHSGGAKLLYNVPAPGTKGAAIAFCRNITSPTEAVYTIFGRISNNPTPTTIIQLAGISTAANGGAADETIMRGVTIGITCDNPARTRDCSTLQCCLNV